MVAGMSIATGFGGLAHHVLHLHGDLDPEPDAEGAWSTGYGLVFRLMWSLCVLHAPLAATVSLTLGRETETPKGAGAGYKKNNDTNHALLKKYVRIAYGLGFCLVLAFCVGIPVVSPFIVFWALGCFTYSAFKVWKSKRKEEDNLRLFLALFFLSLAYVYVLAWSLAFPGCKEDDHADPSGESIDCPLPREW